MIATHKIAQLEKRIEALETAPVKAHRPGRMVYVSDAVWQRIKELAEVNRTSASALAELGMEMVIAEALKRPDEELEGQVKG